MEWEPIIRHKHGGGETVFELLRKFDNDKHYAARLVILGLTAYGGTADEAILKLCRMTTSLIDTYYELGGLDE